MTSERRLVFDFSDVRGVGIECAKCEGRVMVPIRGNLRSDVLDDCALCGERLLRYDDRSVAIKDALNALATLRIIVEGGKLPMTIKLEYADPSELRSPAPPSP